MRRDRSCLVALFVVWIVLLAGAVPASAAPRARAAGPLSPGRVGLPLSEAFRLGFPAWTALWERFGLRVDPNRQPLDRKIGLRIDPDGQPLGSEEPGQAETGLRLGIDTSGH